MFLKFSNRCNNLLTLKKPGLYVSSMNHQTTHAKVSLVSREVKLSNFYQGQNHGITRRVSEKLCG